MVTRTEEHEVIEVIVDETIKDLRKENIIGWSMSDVLDVVKSSGYDTEYAREYILTNTFDIKDEGQYIQHHIREARRKAVNSMLFDKDTVDTEVDNLIKGGGKPDDKV